MMIMMVAQVVTLGISLNLTWGGVVVGGWGLAR